MADNSFLFKSKIKNCLALCFNIFEKKIKRYNIIITISLIIYLLFYKSLKWSVKLIKKWAFLITFCLIKKLMPVKLKKCRVVYSKKSIMPFPDLFFRKDFSIICRCAFADFYYICGASLSEFICKATLAERHFRTMLERNWIKK